MGELDADVTRFLTDAGFNLRGCLHVRDYDARVPTPWKASSLLPVARRALVIGSGGRALFASLRHSPEIARREADPFDAYTVRIMGEVVALLAGAGSPSVAGFAHERRGGYLPTSSRWVEPPGWGRSAVWGCFSTRAMALGCPCGP